MPIGKEIKLQLMENDLTQRDLIRLLEKRGVIVYPPELSAILREKRKGPKSDKVIELCRDIITEYACANRS